MRKNHKLSNIKVTGKKIFVRSFKIKDITKRNVDWLNDSQVNAFLSTKAKRQTYQTVRSYVESFKGKNDKLLLGIFTKNDKRHIGNLTLSRIDWESRFAIVGISIGDKDYWGKGLGLEALNCTKKLVFGRLKLNRLEAGCSEANLPSIKLFKKAGFKVEGKLRQRERMGNRLCNGLIMGLLKKDL